MIVTISLLIFIGLVLILLEILVLPGIVSGIIGLGLWFIAVVDIYKTYGNAAGHLSVFGLFVLLAVALWWALRSGVWKRISLHDNIEGRVNELEKMGINVGDHGRTISVLRPMGKAIIEGFEMEVSTFGEMINENTEIEIVSIEQGKIIVKKINS